MKITSLSNLKVGFIKSDIFFAPLQGSASIFHGGFLEATWFYHLKKKKIPKLSVTHSGEKKWLFQCKAYVYLPLITPPTPPLLVLAPNLCQRKQMQKRKEDGDGDTWRVSPYLLLLTGRHPFHLSSFMAPSGMWRLVSAGAQLQELPGFWRWWNEPMWRIYCSSVSTVSKRESLQPSVAKGKQCDIQEVCFCSKRK